MYPRRRPHLRNVYIIELDESLLPSDWDGPRPPVYVGLSSHAPNKRFQQHKVGHKASAHVKKHGLRVRPDLMPCSWWNQPMPAAEAATLEPLLAKILRGLGYWVEGGH